MEQHQLEHLKKLLQREKARNEPNNQKIDAEELSSVDNHPADAATDLMTVTTDMAIEDFKEDEVEKIDAALAAIEAGEYGKCTQCGVEIPYERLEAMPTALTCVEHMEVENS